MNTSSARSLAPLTLLLGFTLTVPAANWPRWRGPSGTGISDGANPPLKWSSSENVRWRVDLPERGNSSPVVWGDRVFITQAVSEGSRRTVMCFNRADGKLLWQSGVSYPDREQTQRDNPYCSATPVTDGERVIASFGSAGLYCYDFAGKELWHRELGKMQHNFGNAASPIIVGDLCVLNFGPDEKARLVAVNKRTGEIVWEAQPPKVDIPAPAGRGGGGFAGPGGGGNESVGRGGGGGEGRERGGAFGPGNALAAGLIAEGDKNGDKQLTADELTAATDAWFDKLDTAKAGKIDQQAFGERLGQLISFPGGPGGRGGPADGSNANAPDERPAERRGGRGAGGFARFLAPGLFTATDANKDAALTREEWTGAFAKWFADGDKEKSGTLDEPKLRETLNAALPRPQFGGPGGGGGRGGGGRGGGPGGGASWSTPVVVNANGREELIITLPGCVAGYDPKTGQQLWISKGLGGTIYTSPVFGENVLIGMTSGPGGGSVIAVKPGGNGDVTEAQRLWRLERFKSGIGSGVIRQGHFYSISQDGIASCTELQTGKSIWEERLRSSGSRGSSWSSMVLVGDRIYVPNQNGDVFVIRAAPQFELLATNSVNEATNASLAVADGEIFMRTDKALRCIAESK